MIDVRNTHRKSFRLNSVMKGSRAPSTKQEKYLTWHRWGFDRKALPSEDLVHLFHHEWEIVLRSNMEKYGRDDPWVQRKGSYVLKDEVVD